MQLQYKALYDHHKTVTVHLRALVNTSAKTTVSRAAAAPAKRDVEPRQNDNAPHHHKRQVHSYAKSRGLSKRSRRHHAAKDGCASLRGPYITLMPQWI